MSLGLFLITVPQFTEDLSLNTILYTVYALVFLGGLVRSFLGPTIFSLLSLIVPKKIYPNAATWSSSTWQLASMFGPALAGVSISFIGVHWSLCLVFAFSIMALVMLSKIESKPILNPKIGEPIFKSLKEGLNFVFTNKTILGAISLDMIQLIFL